VEHGEVSGSLTISRYLVDWKSKLDYPVYTIKKSKQKEKMMAKSNMRKKHRLMVTVQFEDEVSEAEAVRIGKQAFEGLEGMGMYRDGTYVYGEIKKVSRPAT
jgi:hypothetical protein